MKTNNDNLKVLTINVAEEFSDTPKGRDDNDGLYNGQKFSREFLEPNFDLYDKIIINLDNLYGIPSSFREEAFGGLTRKIKDSEKVLRKLEFICNDQPPMVDIIKQDIKNAIK